MQIQICPNLQVSIHKLSLNLRLQHTTYLVDYLAKCVEVLCGNKAVFVPVEEMREEMTELFFL